jgi:hypothetical protein
MGFLRFRSHTEEHRHCGRRDDRKATAFREETTARLSLDAAF